MLERRAESDPDRRYEVVKSIALRRVARKAVLFSVVAVFLGAGLVFAFASDSSIWVALYSTFFFAAWFIVVIGSLVLGYAKCPRCREPFHSRGFYTNHFSGVCLHCGLKIDGSNV